LQKGWYYKKEYTVFEMGLESRLGDMSTYRVLFE